MRIYSTDATASLVAHLTRSYQDNHAYVAFDLATGNHDLLLQHVINYQLPYFVSSHRPGTDRVWAAPIAQDGLAMIVHPQLPLEQLTLEDLRRIYRGHISNWQQLGGMDLDVTVFSREDGSDTRYEFERLVMGRDRTTTNAQVLVSSAAMIDRVASVPGSIGYVPISQLQPRVRSLALDGVMPSRQAVQENRYPLRSTIYVIGSEEPQGMMRVFMGWAQGADGQSLLDLFAPLPR
jgi:phosphate transport system substrate-binding protein